MSDKIELFYAPTSPYVRKVMACAIELGIADRIVKLPSAAHPLTRDERIAAFNPLAKAPAAKLADGALLFDSRVICEYLDDLAHGALFPAGRSAGRFSPSRPSVTACSMLRCSRAIPRDAS
jgi:glutathione S-transferase